MGSSAVPGTILPTEAGAGVALYHRITGKEEEGKEGRAAGALPGGGDRETCSRSSPTRLPATCYTRCSTVLSLITERISSFLLRSCRGLQFCLPLLSSSIHSDATTEKEGRLRAVPDHLMPYPTTPIVHLRSAIRTTAYTYACVLLLSLFVHKAPSCGFYFC